jgi:hypothetical protein
VSAEVVDASNVIIQAVGDPAYVPPDGVDRAMMLLQKITYLHELIGDLVRQWRERPAGSSRCSSSWETRPLATRFPVPADLLAQPAEVAIAAPPGAHP